MSTEALKKLLAKWEKAEAELIKQVEASPSEAWYETGQAVSFRRCIDDLRTLMEGGA